MSDVSKTQHNPDQSHVDLEIKETELSGKEKTFALFQKHFKDSRDAFRGKKNSPVALHVFLTQIDKLDQLIRSYKTQKFQTVSGEQKPSGLIDEIQSDIVGVQRMFEILRTSDPSDFDKRELEDFLQKRGQYAEFIPDDLASQGYVQDIFKRVLSVNEDGKAGERESFESKEAGRKSMVTATAEQVAVFEKDETMQKEMKMFLRSEVRYLYSILDQVSSNLVRSSVFISMIEELIQDPTISKNFPIFSEYADTNWYRSASMAQQKFARIHILSKIESKGLQVSFKRLINAVDKKDIETARLLYETTFSNYSVSTLFFTDDASIDDVTGLEGILSSSMDEVFDFVSSKSTKATKKLGEPQSKGISSSSSKYQLTNGFATPSVNTPKVTSLYHEGNSDWIGEYLGNSNVQAVLKNSKIASIPVPLQIKLFDTLQKIQGNFQNKNFNQKGGWENILDSIQDIQEDYKRDFFLIIHQIVTRRDLQGKGLTQLDPEWVNGLKDIRDYLNAEVSSADVCRRELLSKNETSDKKMSFSVIRRYFPHLSSVELERKNKELENLLTDPTFFSEGGFHISSKSFKDRLKSIFAGTDFAKNIDLDEPRTVKEILEILSKSLDEVVNHFAGFTFKEDYCNFAAQRTLEVHDQNYIHTILSDYVLSVDEKIRRLGHDPKKFTSKESRIKFFDLLSKGKLSREEEESAKKIKIIESVAKTKKTTEVQINEMKKAEAEGKDLKETKTFQHYIGKISDKEFNEWIVQEIVIYEQKEAEKTQKVGKDMSDVILAKEIGSQTLAMYNAPSLAELTKHFHNIPQGATIQTYSDGKRLIFHKDSREEVTVEFDGVVIPGAKKGDIIGKNGEKGGIFNSFEFIKSHKLSFLGYGVNDVIHGVNAKLAAAGKNPIDLSEGMTDYQKETMLLVIGSLIGEKVDSRESVRAWSKSLAISSDEKVLARKFESFVQSDGKTLRTQPIREAIAKLDMSLFK